MSRVYHGIETPECIAFHPDIFRKFAVYLEYSAFYPGAMIQTERVRLRIMAEIWGRCKIQDALVQTKTHQKY